MTDKNTVQLIEPPAPRAERRSKTITKIALKISKIMDEIRYVKKDGQNKALNYKYVTSEDLVIKCTAALVKHKVIMLTDVEEHYREQIGAKLSITTIKIRVTFVDVESGEYLTSSFVGEGADYSGDKGAPKAHTNANKYALLKTFGIASGEDPENEKKMQIDANAMTKEDLYKDLEHHAKMGRGMLRARYAELCQMIGKNKITACITSKEIEKLEEIKLSADKEEKERLAVENNKDVPF